MKARRKLKTALKAQEVGIGVQRIILHNLTTTMQSEQPPELPHVKAKGDDTTSSYFFHDYPNQISTSIFSFFHFLVTRLLRITKGRFSHQNSPSRKVISFEILMATLHTLEQETRRTLNQRDKTLSFLCQSDICVILCQGLFEVLPPIIPSRFVGN